MARRVAVVGAGMTRFVRRAQETGKELAWEASREALASCELSLDRVDAVCLTSAPDAFDGVHMKGEYLSDGAGAFGRPYMRTYVGGGSGVFTAIQRVLIFVFLSISANTSSSARAGRTARSRRKKWWCIESSVAE